MRAVLLVFLGGGIGSAIRHAVNVAFGRWFGTGFPFHTLFENVSGSVVMGLLATYFALRTGSSQSLRLFLTTGVLGGYTTFSAFSLDSMLLWERGQYGAALVYVATSVGAAIVGLALGTTLLRALG
jgi:CrcB protein